MADNELSLLDDGLEDDDQYEIGKEDEDALLADDYDVEEEAENQTEDDVLEIGVNDALDDLESDIQDPTDDCSIEVQHIKVELPVHHGNLDSSTVSIQSQTEADSSVGDPVPPMESEEEEEEDDQVEEERDRFKSERTNVVSLKSGKTYGNIPDSLDNVIPPEEIVKQKVQQQRRDGNWRGRRGGRGILPRHAMARGGIRPQVNQQGSFSGNNVQPQYRFLGPRPSPNFHPGFPRHTAHLQPPQQPLINTIHINPHFRGQVQPHPEARLIWDAEQQNHNFHQPQFMPPSNFESYSTPPPHPLQQMESPHTFNLPGPQHQQFYSEMYPEQPASQGSWNNPSDGFYQGGAPFNQGNFHPQSPAYQIQHPGEQQPVAWQQPGPMDNQPFSQQVNCGQDVFRHPGPPPSSMRFHQSGPPQNFNQKMRPRFPGQMNGPRKGNAVAKMRKTILNQQITQQQPPQIQQPPQQKSSNFRSPQKRQSFENNGTNVVPVKQIRYEQTGKRKKRMPVMSNLHEVPTVDTLPQSEPSEDEDEETREYRRKIEEQKKQRELFLQQKETRRKMAALEKQRLLQQRMASQEGQHKAEDLSDATAVQVNVDPPQGNAITTIVNHKRSQPQIRAISSSPAIRGGSMRGRGRGRGITNSGPPTLGNKVVKQVTSAQPVTPVPAPGQRIVRAVAPPAKRVVLNQVPLQQARKVLLSKQQQQQQQQPRIVLQKAPVSGNNIPNRTVVSNQNSGITVVAKPNEQTTLLPPTKVVAVDNLSASTSEAQLKLICQRIGAVENIQMIPAKRKAVITFNTSTAAATFFNRYQRKMIDLSLINVTLVVQ